MTSQFYIGSIKLHNFRNYFSTAFNCSNKSIVLYGDNGVGKTNVLEAISLLSKGRGIRGASTIEMQNYQKMEDFWAVNYKIHVKEDAFSVGIARSDNRRVIVVDDKSKTSSFIYKLVHVIWLIPELDYIFLKSSSERLKFFDRIVNVFDNNYAFYIINYEKVKRERSKLLKNQNLNNLWLTSLETSIATNGIKIALIRSKVLNILRQFMKGNNVNLGFPQVLINIESQVSGLVVENDLDRAIKIYSEKLYKSREKDLIINRTTFGVHNDNLQVFHVHKKLLANTCSTGEQKIMLLSLILSTVVAKYQHDKIYPILLLDDIMSHLDEKYREVLLNAILKIGCQTWITDVNCKNFVRYQQYFEFFSIPVSEFIF